MTKTSAGAPAHGGKAMRQLLVEGPTSLGARARLKRWDLFRTKFPDAADMSVLDLGGTVESWRRAPVRPRRVTVLNLFEPGESQDESVVPVTGDACAARSALESAGSDTSFDLVFSNSLLEHVGGHARRVDLAHEVSVLAPHHWVQTPYRYFPVEPHWLFPGMQFMPVVARVAVARRWPLVHTRPTTYDGARDSVLWTELVSVAEMQAYFPGSEIVRERLAGLTKSLIAVS